MKYYKELIDIINANEENRLVIFVGSGVSANSNIPTWGQLIKSMSASLGGSGSEGCISQSDYLNIAEYFYLADESPNHQNYYQYISNKIGGEFESNIINDIIFKILPHHIITTNYDHLLENSNEINSTLYSVIKKDDDLLKNISEHYIIKMHGDIDDPKTIVLKESDYLNYEYTHTLISTYIKSLLIDHTFLFIGYSLNDYNLKLIISWINHFCEIYDISKRPNNYIVLDKPTYEYEKKKLKSSNIYVIDSKEAAGDFYKESSLESQIGKNLFSLLYSINEKQTIESNKLDDYFEKNYSLLLSYSKISIHDVLNINDFKEKTVAEYRLSTLILGKTYFNYLVEAIEKSDIIKTVFIKSGIKKLFLNDPESPKEVIISFDDQQNCDKLFCLYIDNDYRAILACLEKEKNVFAKIYYYSLFDKHVELDELFNSLEYEHAFDKSDVVSALLFKVRKYLIDYRYSYNSTKTEELRRVFDTVHFKYRKVSGFLKDIILDYEKYYHYMQIHFTNLLEIYDTSNHKAYLYDIHTDLYKIQAYAYDYYEFVKFNYIPIDYYSNPKRFFSHYLEAILLTYSPKTYIEKNVNFFGIDMTNNYSTYVLNEYDFDIFVKYSVLSEIKNLIKKYHVNEIKVCETIEMSKKFTNLLSCYEILAFNRFYEQVEIFSLLLSRINIKPQERTLISNAFLKFMISLVENNDMMTFDYLLPALKIFVDQIFENRQKIKLAYLFLTNIDINNHIRCNKSIFETIKNTVCKINNVKNRKYLQNYINCNSNEPNITRIVFSYRYFLNQKQRKAFFKQRINELSFEMVFHLLIEKTLRYDNNIEKIVLKFLEKGEKAHQSLGAMKVEPDPLKMPLMYATLLCILPGFFSVKQLEKYSEYSVFIEFMLCPEQFDYSLVDIDHYMWENLIYSEKYSQYFFEHKKDILTDDLKTIFKKDVSTKNQEKIVYGLLLPKDELREF